MALINIEYGSLASSDIMNKNFMYLDDKIAENSESILTSISSILSNIATINSRLSEITENLLNSDNSLTAKIEDYKSKTKLLVKLCSMVPNWAACYEISLIEEFVAPSNGYLLVIPASNAQGTVLVNNVEITLKKRSDANDNAAELMSIPVCKADKVFTEMSLKTVYFLPSQEVVLEDF